MDDTRHFSPPKYLRPVDASQGSETSERSFLQQQILHIMKRCLLSKLFLIDLFLLIHKCTSFTPENPYYLQARRRFPSLHHPSSVDQQLRDHTQRNFPHSHSYSRKLSLNSHGEFCSEVFLESTDAFGIVYNANYLTLYQRALEQTLIPTRPRPKATATVVIEKCEDIKFAQAAKLGDVLRIVSCLKDVVEVNSDSTTTGSSSSTRGKYSIWQQTCTRLSDGALINSASSWVRLVTANNEDVELNGDLFSSFETTQTVQDSNSIAFQKSLEPPPGKRVISDPIRIFSDELQILDISTSGDTKYGVGLLSALRYFERCRTLYFGGPSDLSRFTEEGLAIVVAKIDNLMLHHPKISNDESDGNDYDDEPHLDVSVTSGDNVIVDNYVQVRGKSIVTFHQRLYLDIPNKSESSNPTLDQKDEINVGNRIDDLPRIAEGSIVLACLNATSGRASSLPEWAREKM